MNFSKTRRLFLHPLEVLSFLVLAVSWSSLRVISCKCLFIDCNTDWSGDGPFGSFRGGLVDGGGTNHCL